MSQHRTLLLKGLTCRCQLQSGIHDERYIPERTPNNKETNRGQITRNGVAVKLPMKFEINYFIKKRWHMYIQWHTLCNIQQQVCICPVIQIWDGRNRELQIHYFSVAHVFFSLFSKTFTLLRLRNTDEILYRI